MRGSGERPETTPRRVLVVDDDPTVRVLAREALEQSGFSVAEAGDGREGLAVIERHRPEAVLLDVMMPEMSGFGFLRGLPDTEGAEGVSVIIMTALDDIRSINQAYDLGATDFITKPINWPALGHHVRFVLRARDAVEALERSEARNRALLDALPDVILRISGDGLLLDYRPAGDRNFPGGPRPEPGSPLERIFPPETADAVRKAVAEALAGSKIMTLRWRPQGPGESGLFEIRTVRSGPDEALVILRDITDQERLEEEIRKSQKLSSVSELAGGIAHDFNNMLMGILGNVSLARMSVPPSEPPARHLEKAEEALGRARALTHQLLTFSRGGDPVKRTLPVAESVREAVEPALSGTGVKISVTGPPDPWPAEIDPEQMRQVFSNLALNAAQAMEGAGTLAVTLENVHVGPAEGIPIPPGRYVRLCFTDTGPGIPAEALGKIFDPFYTTRPDGRGLGLSVAFSVVRKHGGLITAKSPPGSGATLTILLPASENAPEETADPREMEAPGGKGTVLVMDDEAMILELMEAFLNRLGYQAETAREGRAAIDLYRRAKAEGRPFDAVIMDLTVPDGMGGREAMAELIKSDPEVRAIVASGYSNDPVLANYREYGFRACLGKPFRIGELGRALRETIHGTASSDG